VVENLEIVIHIKQPHEDRNMVRDGDFNIIYNSHANDIISLNMAHRSLICVTFSL
jgi:hypothetical protein